LPESEAINTAKPTTFDKIAKIEDKTPVNPKFTTKEMLKSYVGEETGKIWGTKVKYLNPLERTALEVFVKDGKLIDISGKLYDTTTAKSVFGSGKGKAIFVMDESGKMYISQTQTVGKFHHSSFLSGKPVASAGEIVVENGKIIEISNRSGHYQPTQIINLQVINELKRRGIDTSNIKITGF
jgi:hypothetical protein